MSNVSTCKPYGLAIAFVISIVLVTAGYNIFGPKNLEVPEDVTQGWDQKAATLRTLAQGDFIELTDGTINVVAAINPDEGWVATATTLQAIRDARTRSISNLSRETFRIVRHSNDDYAEYEKRFRDKSYPPPE